MQRISVVGTSGSGKTTLARRLSSALDLPHLELDAVFHQPGWTELPTDEFRARVGEFVAGDRWVVCGKYAAVRDLIWARADLVLFLDHHRLQQTLTVVRRTFRRALCGEELWNGNRETWRGLWPVDGQKSIVRWTWDNVPRVRATAQELALQPPHDDLRVVRLRGWPEIDAFLAAASRTEAAGAPGAPADAEPDRRPSP